MPPALSLVNRLRKYAGYFDSRPPDAVFFPGPNGRPFALRTVYTLFREMLLQCGIPHAGRGKGQDSRLSSPIRRPYLTPLVPRR